MKELLHMRKFLNFRGNKLSQAQQLYFFKNLARLTSAHIPLAEAMLLVGETTKNKKAKSIILELKNEVVKGISLSKSMRELGLVRSNIIHLVSIGEKSGELSLMLGQIASYLHTSLLLRRKIVGAFVYPCIIGFATIGFTFALVAFIFPKIIPIFASLHVALPLTTRIMIASVYFMTHYSLYAILFLLTIYVAMWLYIKKNKKLKLRLILFVFHLPFLGTIMRAWNCAEFSRTLGTLLGGGSFLAEAVFVSTEPLLLPYKILGPNLKEHVEKGGTLSQIIHDKEFLFPSPTAHVIAVGERSAELVEACNDLSKMFDEQIDSYVKTLTQMIEPLLMTCMGIIVGFVALSIITPIYAITQNIH